MLAHHVSSWPRQSLLDAQDPLELDDAKKILLMQAALKCADLGHVAESLEVHLR